VLSRRVSALRLGQKWQQPRNDNSHNNGRPDSYDFGFPLASDRCLEDESQTAPESPELLVIRGDFLKAICLDQRSVENASRYADGDEKSSGVLFRGQDLFLAQKI